MLFCPSNSYFHNNIIESMSKYLPLVLPCPVSGCNDKTVYTWCHAGCGSRTELNSDGKLRCSSHTYTEDWVFDWQFKCSTGYNHNSGLQYADSCKIICSLALLSDYQKPEHRDWTERLLDNLTLERIRRK